MDLSSLIAPNRVVCGLEGGSKKRTLELIATHIASSLPTLEGEEIFRRLMARERLGSTGIGQGIAIPHCRLENCTGSIGALFKLKTPLPFDAIDDAPVDLIFALIVPEEANDSHLQTLRSLAELFSNTNYLQGLRKATTDGELYDNALTTL
ncbi:PTS sugar transporter subunit IIA [Marinibactrum halimedae]|uniref:Nitrogen regulatory protein n=1 Tax=Marinibactrum halimedae TaxID=1444977 RepID=A0AA37T246_9GAMM|nr:PTS sugar transporter subunit IIA [Marinibactrum halimedae]MCD9457522.1 PTS sugar transporter subunit IIA [Marinibactrum halimedae]GLS25424.1 nitrogen regulatory protein [Marinibactrum halimedae]